MKPGAFSINLPENYRYASLEFYEKSEFAYENGDIAPNLPVLKKVLPFDTEELAGSTSMDLYPGYSNTPKLRIYTIENEI